MRGLKGITPPVAILAILVVTGVGVGTPVALAEMQHRGVTKFTPIDAPYGIMRAGEAIMEPFQLLCFDHRHNRSLGRLSPQPLQATSILIHQVI